MYDVPGRVNNLYKDPVVPYPIEAEPDEAISEYPPACEFTRATGRGTAEYCKSFGQPPPLTPPSQNPWIVGLICVVVFLLVVRS